eukprot:667417-Hanusia_phi.AAC.6
MTTWRLGLILLLSLASSTFAGCPEKDQLVRKLLAQAPLTPREFADAIQSCGADEFLFMELGAFLHRTGVYHHALPAFW